MFMTSSPKLVDALLGGWQVNGIGTYQTGTPIAISNGGNNSKLGSPGQRPNNNGKSAKLAEPTMDRYFDTSVFSQAGNFTFGNVGRFLPDLRLPGTNNWDMSLFKNFSILEKLNMQFRAEAFNALNHPVWAAPGTTVNATSGFGQITSKNGNRQLQLALKLNF